MKNFSIVHGIMLAILGFVLLIVVNTYTFGTVKAVATTFLAIFILVSFFMGIFK